tara:strand:- start:64 stop:288 length:225 start_codon:yes stop_codon:yes gene_type:complete
MSKYFRDWEERCTNDFDNLSKEEQKEWKDFCLQQEIDCYFEEKQQLNNNVPKHLRNLSKENLDMLEKIFRPRWS